jgi:hypothetical protein
VDGTDAYASEIKDSPILETQSIGSGLVMKLLLHNLCEYFHHRGRVSIKGEHGFTVFEPGAVQAVHVNRDVGEER